MSRANNGRRGPGLRFGSRCKLSVFASRLLTQRSDSGWARRLAGFLAAAWHAKRLRGATCRMSPPAESGAGWRVKLNGRLERSRCVSRSTFLLQGVADVRGGCSDGAVSCDGVEEAKPLDGKPG